MADAKAVTQMMRQARGKEEYQDNVQRYEIKIYLRYCINTSEGQMFTISKMAEHLFMAYLAKKF